MAFPLDDLRSPGPDALARLLAGWFGARAFPGGSSTTRGPFPRALIEAHRVVSAYPETFNQDHLIELDELEPEDGRIVFLRENQDVCRWWINVGDVELDDPPVWAAEREWEIRQEPECLRRFLIETALVQLIVGHSYVASGAPEAGDRARALEPLERLELGPMTWPGTTTFFAGNELLGMLSDDGKSPPWLWIGSRDPAHLEYLDPIVGEYHDGTVWEGFARWDE